MKDNFDLYYIEWVDSRGGHASWTHLDDIESDYCILSSVGWAIKETDDLIHLMPHLGDDPKQGCGDMVIPKICIKEKIKLSQHIRTFKSAAHKVLHDKKNRRNLK